MLSGAKVILVCENDAHEYVPTNLVWQAISLPTHSKHAFTWLTSV